MGRSPRTVKLVEAFRTILRAIYPRRPALADEIQSYAWDHFGGVRFWFGTHLTSDEIIAVNQAFKLLDELVAREKIRLRGALGPAKPEEDIDQVDASAGKLHIFDGKLYFLENKVPKTYHRVRCYEIDVRRCVAELRSETKRPAKPTSETELQNFTTNYSGQRTLKAFTDAAEAAGLNVTRERRIAALDTLGPRRPGRPRKIIHQK